MVLQNSGSAAVTTWIVVIGLGNRTWLRYDDGTIGAVQFGFEISGTGGVAKDFTMNSFSITAN